MLSSPIVFPVFIAVAIVAALAVFFHFVPFFLWLSAKVSGVHISLIQLFLMRIRNVPPGIIVPSLIEAHKADLKNITRDNLEAHYMTGGHVQRVVHALVSASKANINLSFEKATAIDLAGRDVFEAVQTSVNPKVIDTPPVAAVAKNGIQLIAKARVTVRANIHQLVGGAGEDTILARVGEGIVSSIGSAENHEQVLENPDSISKLVLKKGLDAGTAFEILSIDIADIDVGKNIGAALQIDQANADKNIAQAKAARRTHGFHGLLPAGKPERRHGHAREHRQPDEGRDEGHHEVNRASSPLRRRAPFLPLKEERGLSPARSRTAGPSCGKAGCKEITRRQSEMRHARFQQVMIAKKVLLRLKGQSQENFFPFG